MSIFLISYVIAFVAFAAIDVTWLSTMGASLYKATLGDILAPEIRIAPAIVFYLMYPAGLVYFAVDPALRDNAVSTAIVNGALFGLFTYGTYELTNYATLRNWTFGITAINMAYGAAASAVVAAIVYKTAPAASRLISG